MTAPATGREEWLGRVAALMAPRFEELGYPLPRFRLAIGFTSAGKRGSAIGEAWTNKVSADDTHEILIRPDYDDAALVAAILAHELIHIAVGLDQGHRGAFHKTARGLGFLSPVSQLKMGPDGNLPAILAAWLAPILEEVGALPHAALDFKGGKTSGKPKQGTRNIKCKCVHINEHGIECGYTLRTTRQWLDTLGAPICPGEKPTTDGDEREPHGPMSYELPEEEAPDEAPEEDA